MNTNIHPFFGLCETENKTLHINFKIRLDSVLKRIVKMRKDFGFYATQSAWKKYTEKQSEKKNNIDKIVLWHVT